MRHETTPDRPRDPSRITDPRAPAARAAGILVGLALPLLVASAADAGCGEFTSEGPWGGSVVSLVVDPGSPSTVLASLRTNADAKVFRSEDGGVAWTPASAGLAVSTPGDVRLVRDPSASTTIWAATPDGVFRSTDDAATWEERNTGLTDLDVRALVVDPGDSASLLAGAGGGGVFRSADSGASWSASSTGLTDFDVLGLAIDPSTPATVYAATEGGGVFQSVDGGSSWTASNTGITGVGVFAHAIVVDPSTPSTLFVSTAAGVYRTLDGAASWTLLDSGIPTADASVLAIAPTATSTVFAAVDGALYRTTDGGTQWAEVGTGLSGGFPLSVTVDPTLATTVFAGTGAGVSRSLDTGSTWAFSSIGLPFPGARAVALDPSSPQTVLAGTGSGVARSFDGGSTWELVNEGLTGDSVSDLVFDPVDSSIVFALNLNDGVFRSTDGGDTWIVSNTGIDMGGIAQYSGLFVDPATPTTLLLSTFFSATEVYRSLDGGATWSPSDTGLTGGGMGPLALSVSEAAMYVGGTDGVFRSTDGGATWTASNDGLPDPLPFVLAIAEQPSSPGVLWIGTSTGLYRRANRFVPWAAVAPDLLDGRVEDLHFDPNDSETFYAATRNDGVFRCSAFVIGRCDPLGAEFDAVELVIDPTEPPALYAGTPEGGVESIFFDDLLEDEGTGDGDDTCEGGPVGFDEVQFHRHCDEDWVRTALETGSTYRIETLDLGGGADTAISVHRFCGPELASDDDGGPGLASRLEWTATESGIHNVRVWRPDGVYGPGQVYSIRVRDVSGLLFEDGFESGDVSAW